MMHQCQEQIGDKQRRIEIETYVNHLQELQVQAIKHANLQQQSVVDKLIDKSDAGGHTGTGRLRTRIRVAPYPWPRRGCPPYGYYGYGAVRVRSQDGFSRFPGPVPFLAPYP